MRSLKSIMKDDIIFFIEYNREAGMSFSFFALISRMKYINRWSLMRNTETENIQGHSHEVAVLAHALAVIENRFYGGSVDAGEVAVAAIYHDASEIITGDMPTPIKYDNPGIRDAYKAVEHNATERLLEKLPGELRPDYEDVMNPSDPDVRRIVKAADKLSAYLKCVEEEKAGNTEFEKAKEQTWESLKELSFPALEYFMDNFLPSYELTLDEQSQL